MATQMKYEEQKQFQMLFYKSMIVKLNAQIDDARRKFFHVECAERLLFWAQVNNVPIDDAIATKMIVLKKRYANGIVSYDNMHSASQSAFRDLSEKYGDGPETMELPVVKVSHMLYEPNVMHLHDGVYVPMNCAEIMGDEEKWWQLRRARSIVDESEKGVV